MPFMIGPSPIRRTLKYLESCKLVFRENVRIFSISFDRHKDHHSGARDFVFWHLSQIQYNNPSMQVIKMENLTPTPFIKIYMEDEKPVLIDLDCRTRHEIYNFLSKLSSIIKTKEELEVKDINTDQSGNPIYFGTGCLRHCLCEIEGQIPCPGVVQLPKDWRGISNPNTLLVPPHIKLWGRQKSVNE